MRWLWTRTRSSGASSSSSRRAGVALAVLVATLSCSIPRVVISSNNNYYNEAQSYVQKGAQIISQECLPRRQRQVIVKEVSLVCDHIVSDDDDDDAAAVDDDNINGNNQNNNGFTMYNKQTCLAGDLGKVAIGCKSND